MDYDYFEETTKGHGRIEQRRYWISECLEGISKSNEWANLHTIGMVESKRTIGGKTSTEKRFLFHQWSQRLAILPMPLESNGL